MNIIIRKYTSSSAVDIYESVHVQDEKGNDFLVCPYYVNQEFLDREDQLRFGIDNLPHLLKMMYDAGRAGEPLQMEVEEEQVE